MVKYWWEQKCQDATSLFTKFLHQGDQNNVTELTQVWQTHPFKMQNVKRSGIWLLFTVYQMYDIAFPGSYLPGLVGKELWGHFSSDYQTTSTCILNPRGGKRRFLFVCMLLFFAFQGLYCPSSCTLIDIVLYLKGDKCFKRKYLLNFVSKVSSRYNNQYYM